MANITKAERERRAQEAAQAVHPSSTADFLIEVQKDGVTLSVHPTALAQHKLLGWREINT